MQIEQQREENGFKKAFRQECLFCTVRNCGSEKHFVVIPKNLKKFSNSAHKSKGSSVIHIRKEEQSRLSMEIEEYYDKIYRYCYYKVNDRQLAEDITQETFLRYISNDCREPERYLYRIARNLCIDEYRGKKIESLPEDDVLAQDSFEEALLDRIVVKNAMQMLSEEDRELLILRYVNDEPLPEICRILGISRFAVYRKLKKAREAMLDALSGLIEE